MALCTVTSVLPKPPPIPRLCPHSQSKIITLYYRLQTRPVNILPLGCTHSRGMHLKGCSLLCISTEVFAKFHLLVVKSLRLSGRRARRAEPVGAAVQRSLHGGPWPTTGTDRKWPHSNFKMPAVVAPSSLMNSLCATPVHCCTAYIADRHLTFRPRTANTRRNIIFHSNSYLGTVKNLPTRVRIKDRLCPI